MPFPTLDPAVGWDDAQIGVDNATKVVTLAPGRYKQAIAAVAYFLNWDNGSGGGTGDNAVTSITWNSSESFTFDAINFDPGVIGAVEIWKLARPTAATASMVLQMSGQTNFVWGGFVVDESFSVGNSLWTDSVHDSIAVSYIDSQTIEKLMFDVLGVFLYDATGETAAVDDGRQTILNRTVSNIYHPNQFVLLAMSIKPAAAGSNTMTWNLGFAADLAIMGNSLNPSPSHLAAAGAG